MKHTLLFLFAAVLLAVSSCVKKPHACFEVSKEVVQLGDSATFTSCSENATSYSWEFGDDTLRPGPPTITYPMKKNGVQIISLWAYGNNDEYAVAQRAVEVTNATPQICVTDMMIDVNSTVQFNNCSEGFVSYLWDFGDGSTSTEEQPAHTFTNIGIYTVWLTATVEGGYYSARNSVVITVTGDISYLPATYDVSGNCGPGYPITIDVAGNDITLHNLCNLSPSIDVTGTIDTFQKSFNMPWQSFQSVNGTVNMRGNGSYANMAKLTIEYEFWQAGQVSYCTLEALHR